MSFNFLYFSNFFNFPTNNKTNNNSKKYNDYGKIY